MLLPEFWITGCIWLDATSLHNMTGLNVGWANYSTNCHSALDAKAWRYDMMYGL